jgi:hypothetical protein
MIVKLGYHKPVVLTQVKVSEVRKVKLNKVQQMQVGLR